MAYLRKSLTSEILTSEKVYQIILIIGSVDLSAEHFLKTSPINNSFSIFRFKNNKVAIFDKYARRGPMTGLFMIIGGLLKKVQAFPYISIK